MVRAIRSCKRCKSVAIKSDLEPKRFISKTGFRINHLGPSMVRANIFEAVAIFKNRA